jgi:hypothetical protein
MKTLMSPDDFAAALNAYHAGVKPVLTAPLDDMIAYIEHAEKVGEVTGDLTPEAAKNLRYMARLLSATVFLRSTAQLGGGDIMS